jgi:diphthamide synthase (EF-2-diphthine--ammonia ligase)
MKQKVYLEISVISYLTSKPSREAIVAGHIANAHARRDIEKICSEEGYRIPTICTPEELIGGIDYVERPNR